jgi:hypothetical protein
LHTSLHYAAYRTLLDQFPNQKELFDKFMLSLNHPISQTSTVLTSASGIGNRAAKQVLSFRHSDLSNQLDDYKDTTNYKPVNKPLIPFIPTSINDIAFPEKWQPLTYINGENKPTTPDYIAPHWFKVKPFAITNLASHLPQPPISITRQGYIDQAKHVIEVQAKLTPKQKVIAEYWADGPNSEMPPGHWTVFASYIVERDKLSLSDSIKLFFAITNSLLDASIAVWNAKRVFDYCRPITAIRYLFSGKKITAWGGPGVGTTEIDGSTWRPFQVNTFPTPPFAEYVSGHSGFSMAAAKVLELFTKKEDFGYLYVQKDPLKADKFEEVDGISLYWKTFRDAALEAGESRIYGGIHFYEGNVAGLTLGEEIGKNAFEKAKKYWLGQI